MNIFMTGGTGFVGRSLSKLLQGRGHSLKILTRSVRDKNTDGGRVSYIEGDPASYGPWADSLSDCEVIINLAGASIFKRWTSEYKQKLIESRIKTTDNLVKGLAESDSKNALFISTSAVGYYGFHGDEKLDEECSSGDDFLSELAVKWEASADKAKETGAEVIINRFGVVLGKDGGAIPMMKPLFRYWLGSPLGKGSQYFSWVHITDLVNIILFQIENSRLEGPFNCTAPCPVTNRELTKAIASVMKKPLFMPPVPGFAMKLVLGEFADVLLKGQRVIPKKLMDAGYEFRFPEINQALEDVLL